MMTKQTVLAVLALVVGFGCGEGKSEPDPVNNAAPNNGAANNGAPSSETSDAASGVNYYADVKPILDAHCVSCHTEGAIGPFPLGTYEEVFAVKGLVASVVANKTMPPFIYDTSCREVTHDPTLEDEKIETITAWIAAGAPEGDPASEGTALELTIPEPPVFDTTIPMPVAYTPRQSPDDYRCFIVPWPHETTKYVTGFGVEPGDDAIVHHVIGFLAPSPAAVAQAQALDDAEEGPGYTCFGTANIDEQSWIGSWAPGGVPSKYPEGSGLVVEPGSAMIIQVHYNTLIEEPRPDQTTLYFETADTVQREAIWMPWANPIWLNGNMHIAAGDADATHQFMYDPTTFLTEGQPIRIWGGGLHMHLLGTSIRAWIQRADGSQDCLVDSPRWDFNWQTGVIFDEPITLNPGDRLSLECHWDNSMTNQPVINGQRSLPGDRSWGEGTLDEMCLGVFYMTL